MFFSYLSYFFALLGYIANPNSFLKPLSPAQESQLLEQVASGNYEARGKLIEHNLRLVAYVAKKYYNTSIEKDDLISIGSIGLIKGIDSYKIGMGTKLGTYLVRCIENEILMILRTQKKKQNDTSLEEPMGYDSDGKQISLIDVLSDNDEDIPDKISDDIEVEKLLKKIAERLDEREKSIIILRYGLGGHPELTQKQIAKKLGISRSYVSRIETKAVHKLRD